MESLTSGGGPRLMYVSFVCVWVSMVPPRTTSPCAGAGTRLPPGAGPTRSEALLVGVPPGMGRPPLLRRPGPRLPQPAHPSRQHDRAQGRGSGLKPQPWIGVDWHVQNDARDISLWEVAQAPTSERRGSINSFVSFLCYRVDTTHSTMHCISSN